MDEIVYYNSLYDLYESLLTEKQKEYFKDYYFHNLSFAEMAENYNVSRNAVFKQLHIVVDKLEEYEKKLKLREKRISILEILNSADNVSEDIKKKIDELL